MKTTMRRNGDYDDHVGVVEFDKASKQVTGHFCFDCWQDGAVTVDDATSFYIPMTAAQASASACGRDDDVLVCDCCGKTIAHGDDCMRVYHTNMVYSTTKGDK